MFTPDAGQFPAGSDAEHVTALQLSPVATGSRSTVPSAALGPWFRTVMVNVVV
jgi:hypothetical protein